MGLTLWLKVGPVIKKKRKRREVKWSCLCYSTKRKIKSNQVEKENGKKPYSKILILIITNWKKNYIQNNS